MAREFPTDEDGYLRCVTDIVIGFGNGDASINIIKDIIANARADERAQCAKIADSVVCGPECGTDYTKEVAFAIRNLGDE